LAKTYGEWLKEARESKGWTQQELADKAFMSRSLIAAIERGVRHPNEDDAKALDAALGTGNVLSTFRPGAVKGEVADWFGKALELEQQATAIREFGLSFMPGILQTEAYADAVLRRAYPPPSEEQQHKRLVTRLQRGKMLEDSVTPVVWALLDEGVLRRPFGGPAIMAEQLRHVAALGERDRIRVHVLPFGVGIPLLAGSVSLMWFEDQPPIAYSEGHYLGAVHDSPSVVELIRSAYDQALSDARSLEESLAIIRATAEEYERHD
jgi:transcriptional regulator with XRE-family HTH domain